MGRSVLSAGADFTRVPIKMRSTGQVQLVPNLGSALLVCVCVCVALQRSPLGANPSAPDDNGELPSECALNKRLETGPGPSGRAPSPLAPDWRVGARALTANN